MTPEDSYQTPFDADESPSEEIAEHADKATDDLFKEDQVDIVASQAAWEDLVDTASAGASSVSVEEEKLSELATPFVGMWNQLISTTNWEKGRIVSQWREALIESGASSQQYSDEAWANRVGGVTAPHIGRLRRVHDRFVSNYQSFEGLYWSHFLAALDWEDAPLWLEGASQEKWSVSQMRDKRWQSLGAVETDRPLTGDIVVVDTDEDVVMPAQGGGSTKEYGDEPGASSGPISERPDFGEDSGEALTSVAGNSAASAAPIFDDPAAGGEAAVQPFSGLPELPDDLSDAVETMKLSILRHKSAGWNETDKETVQKYLDAISVMMD